MSDTDFSSFENYADFVAKLASPLSTQDFNAKFATAALGLSGEIGEIAELVLEGNANSNYLNDEQVNKLVDELGDIVWYVAFASVHVVETPFKQLWDEVVSTPRAASNHSKQNRAYAKDYYMLLAISCGSFADSIKKILFHGKPYNPEQKQKLVQYLTDILFIVNEFVNTVCEVEFEVILKTNVEKLSERYKSLKFTKEEFMEKEAKKEVD